MTRGMISPRKTINLVGYPFRSTGRGEHIRAVFRALHAVGLPAKIVDLGGNPEIEPELQQEFRQHQIHDLPGRFRIFHVNGEEVPIVLNAVSRMPQGQFTAGYNIIFPAWELPRYPDAWARALEKFDEVWTASPFADHSIRPAVKVPVTYIPNACQPHIQQVLHRSHFSLPEAAYLVLFFFDAWSFAARKNPLAVIEAFRRAVEARPHANLHLVVKINHGAHDPETSGLLRNAISALTGRMSIVDATLSNNEARNLINCCDCFMSLHRSEGFGRGPAEAMFFGKPVIATGWSGNMEYMQPGVSFPVHFNLVPVKPGEYPHYEGQVWADPDIGHATQLLVDLIDHPALGSETGARARLHMQKHYRDAALGMRYRRRLLRILWSRRLHLLWRRSWGRSARSFAGANAA